MARQDQKWVWNRYWHADRLASCFDSGGSNYPEIFYNEWAGFFETLGSRAKILDLCTGNGAIARMAAEFAEGNGKKFKITGVDMADIDPKKFAAATPGQEKIEFSGGVSADKLPFPKGAFDAVISQYGFEYTDQEKTIREIARTCARPARVKLLCHSKDAVQTQNARAELARLAFVLDELKLHDASAETTDAVWKAEKTGGDADLAQKLMEDFQNKMNALAERARQEDNPFFRDTYGLLRHTFEARAHFPLETLLEKIEDTRREALAHRGRVEALVKAALDPKDEAFVIKHFEIQGFKPKRMEDFFIENGQKLAGRILEFERLA